MEHLLNKAAVKEATRKGIRKTQREQHDRLAKLQDLLDGGDFGCNTNAVTEFANELLSVLGVKERLHLPITPAQSMPPRGACIVLLSNPNSHNYALRTPIVVIGGLIGMGPDGRVGNVLPTHTGSAWRYATETEIDAFFACE